LALKSLKIHSKNGWIICELNQINIQELRVGSYLRRYGSVSCS